MIPADSIKARARELGFSAVGIARAEELDREGEQLRAWLGRGYQASMVWMERNSRKRSDPRQVLPDARSVIALALNYFTPGRHSPERAFGKISRYAWGEDYHHVLGERLEALRRWVEEEHSGSRAVAYVDTGPVMEKAWAQRAGIGWEGKHTNVISRDFGSWIFLGEILTTLELEPDPPATDRCGTCVLCLEACPTQAIVEPYVVDSTRCLSYLTIEHRGELPPDYRGRLEGWIYGCDVCQDVCPWNLKFSQETEEARFQAREGNLAPRLLEWLKMSRDEFSRRFHGSAVKRTKWEGLLRNIRAVLGME
jgi:epoxyqueuosine reductase